MSAISHDASLRAPLSSCKGRCPGRRSLRRFGDCGNAGIGPATLPASLAVRSNVPSTSRRKISPPLVTNHRRVSLWYSIPRISFDVPLAT